MESYVVQYGDTLEKIALLKLGNKEYWLEIAKLNSIQPPYQLFVGQTLKLPEKNVTLTPTPITSQKPANMAWARGFMFVVFEQLPEVGSKNVIRKVAVVPKDYSLLPKAPFANYSLAEHAFLGESIETQLLSTSNKPYGAPKYQGIPLLIDTSKAAATGSKISTVPEVIADLRRYSAQTGVNVDTLIRTIERAEGETLIAGGVKQDSVRRVSTTHTPYIETGEEIWRKFESGKITRMQMEDELASLSKAYNRAKIVGRVGRVITVVGVVFTVADVASASQRSYTQRSFKPIAAETVRQIGGWGGAIAGGKIGFVVGAALGIETGPGLIVTGAIGAIIFGAAGYFGADWIAGFIDDTSAMELRRDVNSVEDMRGRAVTLDVGKDESQYDFSRRALIADATDAQKRMMKIGDRDLPERFGYKFYPLRISSVTKDYKMNWIGTDPTPKDDLSIKEKEWKLNQGGKFTYHLNDRQIDELVRMLFGLSR